MMMNSEHSETSGTARRFMWAVQALALPPVDQERLFPDFAEAADELALEHEETQEAFLEETSDNDLFSGQREAIAALDAQLENMSGPANSRFWTTEALKTATEWMRIRELAAQVLAQMNWPAESPPHDRAIYIGPPGSVS